MGRTHGTALSRASESKCKSKSKDKDSDRIIDGSWRVPPDARKTWSSFEASRAARNWGAHMCSLLDLRDCLESKELMEVPAGRVARRAFAELFGLSRAAQM